MFTQEPGDVPFEEPAKPRLLVELAVPDPGEFDWGTNPTKLIFSQAVVPSHGMARAFTQNGEVYMSAAFGGDFEVIHGLATSLFQVSGLQQSNLLFDDTAVIYDVADGADAMAVDLDAISVLADFLGFTVDDVDVTAASMFGITRTTTLVGLIALLNDEPLDAFDEDSLLGFIGGVSDRVMGVILGAAAFRGRGFPFASAKDAPADAGKPATGKDDTPPEEKKPFIDFDDIFPRVEAVFVEVKESPFVVKAGESFAQRGAQFQELVLGIGEDFALLFSGKPKDPSEGEKESAKTPGK
ncbi:MAG: hypothetical protein WAQ27_06475 [Candidatus Microsaccharimonas sp.]